MEPIWLGTPQWQQIGTALGFLWLFMICLAVAALSFGLAHGLLVSLSMTRQLSAATGRIRIPLYLVSLVGMFSAAFFVYNALTTAYSVLRVIYPRWWI